ncbi:MAG: hypothetical protein ACLQVG_26295 [Terriglobia bacterium]
MRFENPEYPTGRRHEGKTGPNRVSRITYGRAAVYVPNPPISGEREGFWRRRQGIWGEKTAFPGVRGAITV